MASSPPRAAPVAATRSTHRSNASTATRRDSLFATRRATPSSAFVHAERPRAPRARERPVRPPPLHATAASLSGPPPPSPAPIFLFRDALEGALAPPAQRAERSSPRHSPRGREPRAPREPAPRVERRARELVAHRVAARRTFLADALYSRQRCAIFFLRRLRTRRTPPARGEPRRLVNAADAHHRKCVSRPVASRRAGRGRRTTTTGTRRSEVASRAWSPPPGPARRRERAEASARQRRIRDAADEGSPPRHPPRRASNARLRLPSSADSTHERTASYKTPRRIRHDAVRGGAQTPPVARLRRPRVERGGESAPPTAADARRDDPKPALSSAASATARTRTRPARLATRTDARRRRVSAPRDGSRRGGPLRERGVERAPGHLANRAEGHLATGASFAGLGAPPVKPGAKRLVREGAVKARRVRRRLRATLRVRDAL